MRTQIIIAVIYNTSLNVYSNFNLVELQEQKNKHVEPILILV